MSWSAAAASVLVLEGAAMGLWDLVRRVNTMKIFDGADVNI
jgi:hypothetical protein